MRELYFRINQDIIIKHKCDKTYRHPDEIENPINQIHTLIETLIIPSSIT